MTQAIPLPYEPRPRDFALRLKRRGMRALGLKRRRHTGRRALVLLAAVAVPAFAAPEGWQPFTIDMAGNSELALEPMPFEQLGASFPGSALAIAISC